MQSQDDLARSQRPAPEEEKEPAVGDEAAQSRNYMRDLNKITSSIVGMTEKINGKGVPAYNKHEQAGRVGLVDPSTNGQ